MSNGEAARFWFYIEGATDRIVGALDGLEADELNWRPAGPETNSLFVLATHILGALDETLLGVLCGEPRSRDRDAEFVASNATAEAPVARWESLRHRDRRAPGGAAGRGARRGPAAPSPRRDNRPRPADLHRSARRRARRPRRADASTHRGAARFLTLTRSRRGRLRLPLPSRERAGVRGRRAPARPARAGDTVEAARASCVEGCAPHTPIPDEHSAARGSGPPTHPGFLFLWGRSPHAPIRRAPRTRPLFRRGRGRGDRQEPSLEGQDAAAEDLAALEAADGVVDAVDRVALGDQRVEVQLALVVPAQELREVLLRDAGAAERAD